MEFEDVFPRFEFGKVDNTNIYVTMDDRSVRQLVMVNQFTSRDALVFSAMKYRKLAEMAATLNADTLVTVRYLGRFSCPLCEVHRLGCKGCPVREYTGMHDCVDTPYATEITSDIMQAGMWAIACMHEAEFLEMLLAKMDGGEQA